MQTILITGGTGLIGSRLTQYFSSKGYKIIVLSRNPEKNKNNDLVTYAAWNVKKQEIDVDAVQAADYIIHLAGAGVVAKKWTEAYRKEIIDSRTLSSKLIVDTLRKHTHKVKAIISSSAIGWYGPDKEPNHFFTEDEKADTAFLGHTCMLWEQSIEEAATLGIRVCTLRTGIVLSEKGGALEEFKKPLKFGIAAILGSGTQVVSWIHIEDLCRMYAYAVEHAEISGSYNAVAPQPVTNTMLTLTLAKRVRKNFFIPMHVPSFVLKIMMGERSIEVLKSTTVSCEKIKRAGFTFLYPSVEAAIEELID
ncbi:MAG: TIGR01777 family oxidoreductase [Bacteroidetes bacterium]|nr:TIGR01777 family oxidoreductase [Bacteroidota bacterium]